MKSLSMKQQGFTLIEVMVVVVIIGLMASLVQFNFGTKRPEDVLLQESSRFIAIFDVASEYGMLNNVELGLIVNEREYSFVGYDGTQWSEIPEQDWPSTISIPETVEMVLELDDLPIEEPLLFNKDTFKEKDEDDFTLLSEEEQEKKIIPQVYILSGGDISPFSLTFRLEEEMAYLNGVEDLAYRVTGIFSTPLLLEGPVLDDK